MVSPDRPLAALCHTPPRPGHVVWLGLRTARRGTVHTVRCAEADPEQGLQGDHFAARHNKTRQITLLQAEHLPVIAAFLGRTTIDPALLRRNVVVAGINLLSLKGRRIRIGTVGLEVTGACAPCSRMEEALGTGGYNAVRGHGGVTARVIVAGTMCLGDPVRIAEGDAA